MACEDHMVEMLFVTLCEKSNFAFRQCRLSRNSKNCTFQMNMELGT